METRPGPDDASTSRLGPIPRQLPPAPRVSQVDADELDEGLVGMLAEKVERSMGNFRNNLGTDLKPEINLVLKLVIFRLSFFGLSQASPGAKLQNLRLVQDGPNGSSIRPTRRRILLYLLLHPPIFPTYLLTRLRDMGLSRQWPDLPSHDWRRKAWKIILRLEDAARLWELAGWGGLLWDGRYPSILMRLLKLRLVPASPHVQKMVSYEFMNRQLVWSAFTEFMMFSVPLVPSLPGFVTPRTLFAPLTNFLSQPKGIDYSAIPLLPSTGNPNDPANPQDSRKAHAGPLAHLPLSVCPICYLRQTSSPVPLDSIGAGSGISLPRIMGSGQDAPDALGEEGDEDTRVFVPAQTDCWGGCRWCYYCIGEELYKHSEGVEAKLAKSGRSLDVRGKGTENDGGGEIAVQDKWDCLRCGGSVSRAWRVGVDP